MAGKGPKVIRVPYQCEPVGSLRPHECQVLEGPFIGSFDHFKTLNPSSRGETRTEANAPTASTLQM